MATEAQARINEEISGHILSICDLRTRWNTLSLISRLPTETLATIFVHYARDYHSKHRGCPTSTVPSWVDVSYVCRHWRDVALNCPTLWTYIFLVSQRWTEELLARSKKALIKICILFGSSDDASLWLNSVEKVMDHMDRIQELRLHLPATCAHDILSKLPSRAPHLQNLEISVRGNPNERSFVLFDGGTPALRTLELTDCPVPLPLFKLSALTTLNLHHSLGRSQQNLAEFLAMLRCMQDLTYLYLNLNRALPGSPEFISSAAFNTLQKIHLPHLSRLLIAAPLSTVIALLSCVNIPLQTEVRLTCHSERGSSVDRYALLSSLLVERFRMSEDQALSSPAIRSLVIDSVSVEGGARLTFSGSERSCDSVFTSRKQWGSNIPLQIVLDRLRADSDRIISDICCSIPLTHVQSVHVLRPPISSTFWTRALGDLQGLRYIKLSQGNIPELASVLRLTPHDPAEKQGGHADRGSNRIFAPALEELELYEIEFSTEPPERDMDILATNVVRSLCDALSTRKEPRGRLIMTRCTERNSKKTFDADGWWEGGGFHVPKQA